MLPLNAIEKEMKRVCNDYMKGERKMKHYQVIVYGDKRGDSYELKKYNNILAESEKEARETALRYAPDDIAYNTYIHYENLTTEVISSKVV